jgi:hypothetical protein
VQACPVASKIKKKAFLVATLESDGVTSLTGQTRKNLRQAAASNQSFIQKQRADDGTTKVRYIGGSSTHAKVWRNTYTAGNSYFYVDLVKRTCGCGLTETTDFPCYDMGILCKASKLKLESFIGSHDTTDTWKREMQCYKFETALASPSTMDMTHTTDLKLPVAIRQPSGRPKEHGRKMSSKEKALAKGKQPRRQQALTTSQPCGSTATRGAGPSQGGAGPSQAASPAPGGSQMAQGKVRKIRSPTAREDIFAKRANCQRRTTSARPKQTCRH